MLPTALRLALRRLARRPGTTAAHVGGLAVGLACCFLALLFVRDELSYDRFHAGAERIVEIRQQMEWGSETMNFMMAPEGAAEALAHPAGVEAVAATADQPGLVRRTPTSAGVVVDEVRFADPSFFRVFSFPLLEGDARTALDGPGKTILTASLAQALFGDADPVGETVYVERTGFGLRDPAPLAATVTGVAADPPGASSFQFELLVSGQTPVATNDGTAPALGEAVPTYVRLASLADTVAVQAALRPLILAGGSFGPYTPAGAGTPQFVLQHFDSPQEGMTGRPLYLVLFLAIAGLVLLLACVNYATLATALALSRSTEVGVRKTLGASRWQLARLFLAEALVLALVAGGVAVGLVAAGLPAFNAFFAKRVVLGGLGPAEWAAVPLLALLAGLLAGAYPALVLARFRPVAALRGTATDGRGGTRVRQGLVVFQFAVTAVLLASTAVVWSQLDALRSRDLGFEGDRVVTLGLQADRLTQLRDVMKQQAEAIPGVARASIASVVPGGFNMMMSLSPSQTPADPSDDVGVRTLSADADYPATLGLEMAAGAWFTPDSPPGGVVVLNETAARKLGLMTTDAATAIGETVVTGGGETPSEIVGVVRDFHVEGPRNAIEPVVVAPLAEFESTTLLAVQLRSSDARTLAALRAMWERLAPEYPFDPRFVSDAFADQMRQDRQLGQLFGAVGLVAVVLACLGVFGLAAHAAERRRKEIGIRKVLGATVAGLVARLSGEFARLVAVALAVAAPVAWWLARRWLEGFAYPAPLSAGPFVGVAVGVLALALLAAGVHAVRAATADPVRSLRSD